jgi:PIN domain nuclease of toxin-antitoxin system
MIHLDTHVVAWLYAKVDRERIPPTLRSRLESDTLAVSPMVQLELALLHEIGRLTDTAERVLGELARTVGLGTDDSLFAAVVAAAEPLSFTRDPFDRLIGAQAIVAGARLATADRGLREHLDVAIWD